MSSSFSVQSKCPAGQTPPAAMAVVMTAIHFRCSKRQPLLASQMWSRHPWSYSQPIAQMNQFRQRSKTSLQPTLWPRLPKNKKFSWILGRGRGYAFCVFLTKKNTEHPPPKKIMSPRYKGSNKAKLRESHNDVFIHLETSFFCRMKTQKKSPPCCRNQWNVFKSQKEKLCCVQK